MAWLAVDKMGCEQILERQPQRGGFYWYYDDEAESEYFINSGIDLPKGSIKKLMGVELTWDDEPIELK